MARSAEAGPPAVGAALLKYGLRRRDLVRPGISFAVGHPHEAAHLGPLQRRLDGVSSGRRVVVWADTKAPERGAWNVQVFHGLGDKGYTTNPIFLQRGRLPRVRTALNMFLRSLRLPAPFLRPPADPGRRRSRYEQVNAYGPRFRDRLEEMLDGAAISQHGHVALNEIGPLQPDPDGPLLWMPTWDNRAYLGGPPQSSLGPFAHEVALVSRFVPVQIKYHPLTLAHDQDAQARAELEREPGIEILSGADPYPLLRGIRGVLTDTSSLGFEAHCLGLPVALAKPAGTRYEGLHAELAERVPVLSSGRPDLIEWAEAPTSAQDAAWIRDLLFPPAPARNDAFAAQLRAVADGAFP